MSKIHGLKSILRSSLAIGLFGCFGLVACAGAESPEVSEPGDEIAGEEVGEATQAVAEGEVCGKFFGPACDTGLVCCTSSWRDPSGVCRDLDTDPDNCGSCGHVCPYNPHIFGAFCYQGMCL